jgi:2,4-dienoyl-CoA reductase-like NADH-dependent reductase (Old Yellow Enzyme family)
MSSNLFTPLPIRGITLPNRIAVSPMCEYSSPDGFATDWHLVHLGSRAVGGAGLVIVEATAVEPVGRITSADLGIWKDEHIGALQRITAFIKSQGAVPGIQLAHAGRKASTQVPWEGGKVIRPGEPDGWQVVAPSPIPFRDGDPIPHELTIAEIKALIVAFAAATQRALTAGFEVIEIHGAHGYLINEFLSPLSNRRQDEYGGSFENRMRFLREVIGAVREKMPPELPLFLRISASDWAEGGWDIEDSVALARVVRSLGVDLIDASSGGNALHAKIPVAPGYQIPFAERIRRETGMLTGGVGLITDSMQAEEIIASGQADLVLLARELLRDPYFPMHAAQILGVPVSAPNQYLRAFHGSVPRTAAVPVPALLSLTR